MSPREPGTARFRAACCRSHSKEQRRLGVRHADAGAVHLLRLSHRKVRLWRLWTTLDFRLNKFGPEIRIFQADGRPLSAFDGRDQLAIRRHSSHGSENQEEEGPPRRPTLPPSRSQIGDFPRDPGGGRGIRTPGTLPGTVVFKTTAIDHSAIPPRRKTRLNSPVCSKLTARNPSCVTVSVTNTTIRDDTRRRDRTHCSVRLPSRGPPAERSRNGIREKPR